MADLLCRKKAALQGRAGTELKRCAGSYAPGLPPPQRALLAAPAKSGVPTHLDPLQQRGRALSSHFACGPPRLPGQPAGRGVPRPAPGRGRARGAIVGMHEYVVLFVGLSLSLELYHGRTWRMTASHRLFLSRCSSGAARANQPGHLKPSLRVPIARTTPKDAAANA